MIYSRTYVTNTDDTTIELCFTSTNWQIFGMHGERRLRSDTAAAPALALTISRVSYRESSCARLKEWNQIPTNMAVFLMVTSSRTQPAMGQPAVPP